jgi:hypothetical protein
VFATWAGMQATPVGWVADLALLGYGIWTAGSGVVALFNAFLTLDTNTKNANCEASIDAAAKALAKNFVTGTGEVVGGLAGTWGIASSGGFLRIANGIRTVVEFGKRQIGKGTVVPYTTILRPKTTSARYNADINVYKNSDGSWKWPPNDGFTGTKSPISLPVKTRIDRFGSEYGSYFAPEGTPYGQRALPPSSINDPYNVYEVLRELPTNAGTSARAFDQPGGGTQYQVDWVQLEADARLLPGSIANYKNIANNTGGPIAWLVDNGYLKRLTPIGGL